MDKTEKRTAEEIPSSLIELLHAHSINTEFVAAANKMYVTSAPLPYFEAACKMYAAQELDAYKEMLKDKIRNDISIKLSDTEKFIKIIDYL